MLPSMEYLPVLRGIVLAFISLIFRVNIIVKDSPAAGTFRVSCAAIYFLEQVLSSGLFFVVNLVRVSHGRHCGMKRTLGLFLRT